MLPDLLITGDPRVCPLWVLDVISVGIALLALFTIQLGTDRLSWWRCAIAVLVALPLVWRSFVSPPIAIGAYVLAFVTCTIEPGWPLLVAGLGLAGIVITGSLAMTLERSAVLYRSGLRRIVLRWVWVVVITEACGLLAWLVRDIPRDPVLGTLGLVGVAAAVAVIAYLTFLPGKSRTDD